MDADDFQKSTIRTSPQAADPGQTNMLLNAALGLTGEGGEIANAVKKFWFHGHDLNRLNLIEEGGDCLWYLAQLCTFLGITLSDMMAANIAKLAARYPDGFSEERSINRDVAAEYAAMGIEDVA